MMGSLACMTTRKSCLFPCLTDGDIPEPVSGDANVALEKAIAFKGSFHDDDASCAVFAAWALTIGKYIGTEDVVFSVARKQGFSWGFATLSVKLDRESPLSLVLHSLRHDTNEYKPVCPASQHANTVISLGDELPQSLVDCNFLVLRLFPSGSMALRYHHSLLTDAQADNLASTFAHLVSRIHSNVDTLIKDMDYVSPNHLQKMWEFNKDVPEPWKERFHDVVQRHAESRPDAPAIDAWDGQFTYRELVEFAQSLAVELQSRGVGAGVVVPIGFERSAWAVLAMLAVSMAGGAFVSLPPTLPAARREAILDTISAPLVITKADQVHAWNARLPCLNVLEHRPVQARPADLAKPSDLFYVIFTSGSTGAPKGAMISHSNWLDGALRNAHRWGYGPDDRVLQRLSQAFDMSLMEICSSLGSGSCVCVPAEEEVQDGVGAAIRSYRATHIIATPSLAKSLTPDEVPGLKSMCLGGEALSRDLVRTWSERINLFQSYGPCECSINSSFASITRKNRDPLNIGPPNSSALWVVDRRDVNKLVPIGAIGELLVSGPIVGMGYLGNPSKTAEVFLHRPDFIPEHDVLFGHSRFYKTGDLVRWNADGTLTFCGRADNQVKLNGQRIELGEVEHHLALDPDLYLSVVLLPKAGLCRNMLTAISTVKSPGLEANGQTSNRLEEIQLLHGETSPDSRDRIRLIRHRLRKALPHYMVPTVWVFLKAVPLLASGKIDRVRLQTWIQDMSDQTFASVTGKRLEAAEQVQQATSREHQIQQAWSSVLDLAAAEIGLDQSFVALGGDSIKALRVVAQCRRGGLLIDMADVLTCEGVSEAAKLAKPAPLKSNVARKEGENFDSLWKQLREGYDLSTLRLSRVDQVEDVYPCTKAQDAMLLGSVRRPGSYHMRYFYSIHPKSGTLPDVDQFMAAWNVVVARHAALQTVFVDDLESDSIYNSIVLKEPLVDIDVRQICSSTPEDALNILTSLPIRPFNTTGPQHRIVCLNCDGKAKYMMLEASHAIMDGSSQSILLGDFVKACSGTPMPARGPAYRDVVVYQRKTSTEAHAEYFRSYLEGCQPCLLPVSPTESTSSLDFTKMRTDVVFERGASLLARCQEEHITVACAMRAAWALVLRAYTASLDVCFGFVVSLRNAPVKDIESTLGVCIATQPCRVRLRQGTSLMDLARTIQADYLDMVPHQHHPLAESLHSLKLDGNRPLFNTVLSMEWIPPLDVGANPQIELREMREQDDPAEYDLGISVDIRDGEIKLGFLHWPWISDFEITHLATALQKAMGFFIDSPDEPIECLSLLQAADIPQAMPGLNSPCDLEELDDTIVSVIERQFSNRGSATAIESWDGQLSYKQLDDRSTAVAKRLVTHHGVRTGDTVVFCMDRSALTVVAMLGIMRAGGVFVALSPEYPKQRIQTIMRHCEPRLIVADAAHQPLVEGLTGRGGDAVEVVDAKILDSAFMTSKGTLPRLSSRHLAYMVYTSGTTNVPKGILIDHGSLATSVVVGHGRRLNYSADLRVLHFISLNFDISLMEIFTTLAFGACLCVPSEHQRASDPVGAMNQLKVNLAILTPSICRTFSPQDVPSLKILGLGGEPMTRQDLERFADRVQVFNGYGPTEATILVSALGPMKVTDDPTNIGYAVDGTRLWVAEMDDTRRLAPIGSVGELVVESRQLARGYVRDEAKTAEVFVDKLPWLKEATRVYKTGDLVRYAADGSLRYLGRKDTQIKLRGYRIELAEIEHQLRECWPMADVAVESIMPTRGTKDSAILVAFVSNAPAGDFKVLSDVTREDADAAVPVLVSSSVNKDLARRLPSYMLPSAFFNIDRFPLTINGKLDRQRLRDMARHFSVSQLTARQSQGFEDCDPWAGSSELERRLRGLWSEVFGIEETKIHPDDGFFQLGGDSLLSMKLSVAARRNKIPVTAPLVLRHSTVRALAAALQGSSKKLETDSQEQPHDRPAVAQTLQNLLADLAQGADNEDETLERAMAKLQAFASQRGKTYNLDLSKALKASDVEDAASMPTEADVDEPFSLLAEEPSFRQSILDAARRQCRVEVDDIEDLYPATPLQEGMVSLTSMQPGSYTSVLSLDLQKDVDFDRLQTAWQSTVAAHPILRTRIIQTESHGCFQAVLRHQSTPAIETYDQRTNLQQLTKEMGLGRPTTRLGIMTRCCNSDEAPRQLILTMHHSVYDGWSLPLLLSEIQAAYRGQRLRPRPFKGFVRYIQQTGQSSTDFWRGELNSFDSEPFPLIPKTPGYQVTQRASMRRVFKLPDGPARVNFTLSTKMRLAWGLTVSRYTKTHDIVFGVTTAGRGVPVDGIESVLGPTIATTPVRIRAEGESSVISTLEHVKSSAVQSMEHEHIGLQHIAKLGTSSAAACRFQTLIIFQSQLDERAMSGSTLFQKARFVTHLGEETYALVLYCDVADASSSLIIQAKYDDNAISELDLARMLDHFGLVLAQLVPEPDMPLAELDTLTRADWDLLRTWNAPARGIKPPETCLYQEFYERVVQHPDADAVCAWDGSWTYGQLHNEASKLARQLAKRGVGPETFVPLYFDKSKWVSVAMLATAKAGGVFVPLDVSHPLERLRGIVEQLQARLVLTSLELRETVESMFRLPAITPHDVSQDDGLEPEKSASLSPDNGCYAIFTSGSTGKPKGTVVTHRGILASMSSIVAKTKMQTHARMLQFSSSAWDGSVLEYLAPWLSGGCVCVPSEYERRNDLVRGISRMNVNWLHLTPSVLGTLQPSLVPSVRSVMLLGESPVSDDLRAWASEVTLIQAYGPSECSVACTITEPLDPSSDPRDIGLPSACTCWIVDASRDQQLAPIGALGELVVEGPIVSRGYLGDAGKTAEAFVARPKWFPEWHVGPEYRLFKTGDLVRYGQDGRLLFLGRRDTQVKINGQRLELEEVAVCLRRALPDNYRSVVDVVAGDHGGASRLVAFIQPSYPQESGNQDLRLVSPPRGFDSDIDRAKAELSRTLPPYMMPDLYVPISGIPLESSGKTDRLRLRQMMATCSETILGRDRRARHDEPSGPSTPDEVSLRSIWAQVLQRAPEDIGRNDDFFHIGGDSIASMRAAIQCNSLGLAISSADIFRHRTIAHLAAHLRDTKTPPDVSKAPSSMSSESMGDQGFRHGFSRDEVEDVYPCSPMQQGILVTQSRDSRYYRDRVLLEITSVEKGYAVGAQALKQAWQHVVSRHAVLRTLFVPSRDQEGLFSQVVLRNVEPVVTVRTCGSAEDDGDIATEGKPDHSLVLQQTGPDRILLEWTFSHAIMDAMSLTILQRDFLLAYEGRLPRWTGPSYRQYVDYIQGLDQEPSRAYWEAYLKDAEPCVFPSLCGTPAATDAKRHIRSPVTTVYRGNEIRAFCQEHRVSLNSMFHVAWALVLRCYLSLDTVCFGYQIHGRDFPARQLEDIVGPFVNTLTARVHFPSQSSLMAVIREVQDSLVASYPHRYFPLARVYHSRKLQGLPLFNTGVSVQDVTSSSLVEGGSLSIREMEVEEPTEWDLNVSVGVDGTRINVNLTYWSSILSNYQAKSMTDTFFQALDAILAHPSDNIGSLDIVSEACKDQAIKWNSILPASVDDLFFTPISHHARDRPEAEAVCAWDGSFTYGDVDGLSSRLAHHLVRLGLTRGSIVLVYMEKSRWAVIAMLGVLKAGGALATLDVAQPRARLREVCRDSQAKFVLASPDSSGSAPELAANKVVVGRDASRAWSADTTRLPLPDLTPSSPAYVIFTSGSTGRPKGSVIDHRALASMSHKIIPAVGLDTRSRAFQFASYAFDVSIQENLVTLCAGGCVCIPSERQRIDDLVGTMARMRVNFANFTPSLMRILEGPSLDAVKTVVMGGEAPSPQDVQGWPSTTRIINTYGPSECTIFCVMTDYLPEDPRVIGRALGCNTWIVDSRDHRKLVPIGAVGELLIEGPSVSRTGYVNDTESTAAAFVEYPSWLSRLRNGRQERLYRSGDLAQYTADGSIRFIGRKDNQVKVRGQRIELGEVEHHLLRCFPRAAAVVAHLVSPRQGHWGEADAVLVAFVLQDAGGHSEPNKAGGILKDPTDGFRADVAVAESHLRQLIPAYMVPSAFLPVNFFPKSTSFKIDRKALLEVATNLSQQALYTYSVAGRAKRRAETPTEKRIQEIVAQVLDQPKQTVGMDDDFFRLGGDSIVAMRMVSKARQEGLELSVADVFKRPRIYQLALSAKSTKASGPMVSCSLLQPGHETQLLDQAIQGHRVRRANVQDVLPTTQFQREWLERPCVHLAIRIPGPVATQDLKAAILKLVECHAILRTVFVPYSGSIVQVVLRDIDAQLHVLNVAESEELEVHVDRLVQRDASQALAWGAVPFKATLIAKGAASHVLVLRLYHAQYDGVAKSKLFGDLEKAYVGRAVCVTASYADYLSCRAHQKTPEALRFWRGLLESSHVTRLSPARLGGRASSCNEPVSLVLRTRRIMAPAVPEGITIATVFKAAWAVVLCQLTGKTDVVFSQVVNGRSLPLTHVDVVCGTCINIVPVRAAMKARWTGSRLFKHLQKQHARMLPFETVDFQDIVSQCTDWPAGSRFGSVVQHQNVDVDPELSLAGLKCTTSTHVFDFIPRDLLVESSPDPGDSGSFVVRLLASTQMVSEAGADELLDRLDRTLRGLLDFPERELTGLGMKGVSGS